jgi:glycosyltransferase involved in cell wall biosynthesis
MIGAAECGLLVPPGDPHAMASAVTTLIEDPATALAIVRRARHKVAMYTWPRVREAWARIYERNVNWETGVVAPKAPIATAHVE